MEKRLYINKIVALVLCILTLSKIWATTTAESVPFQSAKTEIENMLSGKSPLSYERAIFLTENAYYNSELNEDEYRQAIDFHVANVQKLISANRAKLPSDFKNDLVSTAQTKVADYETALTNFCIYKYLTDTTFFIQGNQVTYHLPYIYSHADPLGSIDWSNTQVLKLLVSNDREGNCFALASLFKILSERLHSKANLCITPGHIFIRHADDKGTYYNVELASHSFPGTGSIQVYTYTTDQALKNNISLRELDQRQSVGLCLIYLAKAYEYITHTKTDDFALQCAELALQYDSLNLNAMLLKGEVMEGRLIEKNKAIPQLQSEIQFQDYQKLVVRLFDLGYREMPDEQKRMIIDRLRDPDKLMAIGVNGLQLLRKQKSFETRKATLSWGLFDEEMLTKPIEIYGRTAFNTITKKITQFNPSDTNTDYPIDQIVFAMSVDPLTAKYPNMSPYLAFGANPILFVDNDGRELTLGGPDVNKTREALISMLNSSDIKNRVTIDENNKVSFNTVGLSKSQMKDNTVVLLSNLVNAKEQYLFEVNTVAQGTDRDNNAPKEYPMYNQGNKTGPIDMNFSTTDRGDEQSQLARGVNQQDYDRANMNPAAGFDGQAVVTPEKKDVEKVKGKPYGNVVYHTLQEVYTRTHDDCNMTQSHQQAMDCETELPAGHPAKSETPGKITPKTTKE